MAGNGDSSGYTQTVFFPLRDWGEPLQQLADLRDVLGLRSTVHTVTRMTNLLHAPCSVQGIFHPPYAEKTVRKRIICSNKLMH
ncbi:MAG: hypothetical protein R3E61_09915 [Pseudomonadales bacterium]